jgi:hypothetical protein
MFLNGEIDDIGTGLQRLSDEISLAPADDLWEDFVVFDDSWSDLLDGVPSLKLATSFTVKTIAKAAPGSDFTTASRAVAAISKLVDDGPRSISRTIRTIADHQLEIFAIELRDEVLRIPTPCFGAHSHTHRTHPMPPQAWKLAKVQSERNVLRAQYLRR